MGRPRLATESKHATCRSAQNIMANLRGEQMTNEYSEQLRSLAEQGMTYSEIARELGKDPHNVRKTCIRIGVTCKKHNDVRSLKPGDAIVTDGNLDGQFIYVSGYEDSTKPLTIRCKACGTEKVVAEQCIRPSYKHRLMCETCKKKELEDSRMKRKAEEEFKRLTKELERADKRRCEQLEWHSCPECGSLFIGRRKYCSKRCMVKYNDRAKDLKRRGILADRTDDNDISLSKLMKKGEGLCYLYGEPCDWNDYKIIGDTFIAGDMYPSIDHVIPLAKGGRHAWSNVKLAHRICNSKKKDKHMPLYA